MKITIPLWFWKSFFGAVLALIVWLIQNNYSVMQENKKERLLHDAYVKRQDSIFDSNVSTNLRHLNWKAKRDSIYFEKINSKLRFK